MAIDFIEMPEEPARPEPLPLWTRCPFCNLETSESGCGATDRAPAPGGGENITWKCYGRHVAPGAVEFAGVNWSFRL